jgi:hypothetical protein
MDYSATVWDPYLQKDIDRIEGVQRRVARFIFNDYMCSSTVTAMMESLKWTPLAERRREQRLILLFKIVNDLVANPTDDITFNNRPGRNSNNRQIKVLSTNTDLYKNSYSPKTIKDWNNLSDSAVHCKTVTAFKTALTSSRN